MCTGSMWVDGQITHRGKGAHGSNCVRPIKFNLFYLSRFFHPLCSPRGHVDCLQRRGEKEACRPHLCRARCMKDDRERQSSGGVTAQMTLHVNKYMHVNSNTYRHMCSNQSSQEAKLLQQLSSMQQAQIWL